MNKQTHMLRGDWLTEILTAHHRNQIKWQTFTLTPNHITNNNTGRFHKPTQTYDPTTIESTTPGPQYHTAINPPEPNINYPGEQWTITPTWIRHAHQTLKEHNLHTAFLNHANDPNNHTSIAHYNDYKQTVTWGHNTPHELRQVALILSTLMEYTPLDKTTHNPHNQNRNT